MEVNLLQQAEADLREAINGADPLSGVVRAHLVLEQLLNEQLETGLPEPRALSRVQLSFFHKAHVLRSLNLLTSNGLNILLEVNSLRNRFAHKLGYEITGEDIDKLGHLCPDLYEQLQDANADLITKFSQIFSRLLGKVIGEFHGGRINFRFQ